MKIYGRYLIGLILLSCIYPLVAREILVHTPAELRDALSNTLPGTTIRIAAGEYGYGYNLNEINGTLENQIVIRAADTQNVPLFEGGSQAFHFIDCNYVALKDIRVKGCTANGINADDGGSYDSPSEGMTFENIIFEDIGPAGNHDGLKLSGLRNFIVKNCAFSGWGGSAIDMVGCQDGIVESCRFVGKTGFTQDHGVQTKGGTERILINLNLFQDAGERSVNAGGSTGLDYFRPELRNYEAKDIEIAGNQFLGSTAPVAYVTSIDCNVHHNTIIYPEKWVMRILQEQPLDQFLPCQNGVFESNLIVYDQRVQSFVNVGPNTEPETFNFNGNVWFCSDEDRRPSLPVEEINGIYQVDPKLENIGTQDLKVKSEDERLLKVGAHAYRVAQKISNDFGDDDDFLPSSDVYLVRFNWEGPNIPGGGDYGEFIHQETPDNYWVFSEAPDQPDLIKARTIRMTTYAEFYTKAIGERDSVYLGIRYKDNVPVLYGPEPVMAYNGSGFFSIGGLGGNFDHQWKVKVIAVSTDKIQANEGKYRFKIGVGTYGSGLKSALAIDRIELATTKEQLTIEDDMSGYFPGADDVYSGMDKRTPWYVSDKPFFPIGFAAGWTGMSELKFRQVADGGFNTLLFYNWMNKSKPYAEEGIWDVMASGSHFGFTEFLNQCEANGLKAIGVFQHDVRYPVIPNYFKTEQACLDFITNVCNYHKGHSALLGWSPVDEPDHSGFPDFYGPLEWCMGIKDAIRKGDPDRPIYALEIGWRQGAFGHFKDIADYQGYDVYPEFGSSVAEIGNRAELLKKETSDEKPFIAFLKAYDRTANQAYMSYAEAYLALIHGANGIFYWSLSGADPIWPTLTQIVSEINKLNSILLPPSITLDVNGKNQLCVDNSDNVEQIFKQDSSGVMYIISANKVNQAEENVRYNVSGLKKGTNIEVLFEDRNIVADEGSFTDDIDAYGRRVYKIGKPVTQTGEIPDNKIMQLNGNYPNPFYSSTVIKYKLFESAHVILKIFDIQGKEIATLVNENQPAGFHQATFYPDSLKIGTYLYKLQAGEMFKTSQMIFQGRASR